MSYSVELKKIGSVALFAVHGHESQLLFWCFMQRSSKAYNLRSGLHTTLSMGDRKPAVANNYCHPSITCCFINMQLEPWSLPPSGFTIHPHQNQRHGEKIANNQPWHKQLSRQGWWANYPNTENGDHNSKLHLRKCNMGVRPPQAKRHDIPLPSKEVAGHFPKWLQF